MDLKYAGDILVSMRVHNGTPVSGHRSSRTGRATLPFFGAKITAPRCGLGPHHERIKGYPASPTSVGEHIRKRRLDLKLFQIDAARRIGCNEMSVVNWENRHTQPALSHMAGIVEFLGFDPLPEGDDFAGKLLHHRKLRGISQKQFAAQIGIDPGTLGRWERGECQPDEKLLRKVRKAGLGMGNAASPTLT